MKLDGATIPLERRRFGEGVDLAARLWCAELPRFVSLSVLFAAPTCLVVYHLTSDHGNGIAWLLAFFFAFSPLFGSVLVAGVGPRVFGEELRLRRTFVRLRPALGRVLLAIWVERIVWFVAVAFAFSLEHGLGYALVVLFLLLRGHRSTLSREVILLEGLRGKPLRRRMADLRMGSSGTQQAWYLGSVLVFGLVSLAFVAVLAQALSWILGVSLFGNGFGIDEPVEISRLVAVIEYQPLSSAAILAVLWFVYPLARLIGFLVYLDLRIQRECWDLEIDFRVEAARIEGASDA